MARICGSGVAFASAGILVLGLITATPNIDTARTDGPAVRVVEVALVAIADQPPPLPKQRVASAAAANPHHRASSLSIYDFSDFLNSLPRPIPELFHAALGFGLFFVFIPAFWVVVNVVSAANVVLHASGLPLLPNVLDPPFGPGSRTSANAGRRTTVDRRTVSSGAPKAARPISSTGAGRTSTAVHRPHSFNKVLKATEVQTDSTDQHAKRTSVDTSGRPTQKSQ